MAARRERGRSVRWTAGARLNSLPTSVRIARSFARHAAQLAGFAENDVDLIEIAVGEAVTNASLHAYGGRGTGWISVRFAFDGAALTVTVHDSGQPVTNRLTVPQSLPPPGMGRGLYLINRLMDKVEIVQPGPRRKGIGLVMVKRLPPVH